jgi:hypothetical protein
MTIFRSDGFLALLGVFATVAWIWLTVSAVKSGRVRVGGQTFGKSDAAGFYWCWVSIMIGMSGLMVILMLQFMQHIFLQYGQ